MTVDQTRRPRKWVIWVRIIILLYALIQMSLMSQFIGMVEPGPQIFDEVAYIASILVLIVYFLAVNYDLKNNPNIYGFGKIIVHLVFVYFILIALGEGLISSDFTLWMFPFTINLWAGLSAAMALAFSTAVELKQQYDGRNKIFMGTPNYRLQGFFGISLLLSNFVGYLPEIPQLEIVFDEEFQFLASLVVILISYGIISIKARRRLLDISNHPLLNMLFSLLIFGIWVLFVMFGVGFTTAIIEIGSGIDLVVVISLYGWSLGYVIGFLFLRPRRQRS